MKQLQFKPFIEAPFKDGQSLEKWVEQCLKMKHDKAINQAISGMMKVSAEQVRAAINSQFSDFRQQVGPRVMRVRLISIPISVKSEVQIAEDHFHIQDVTPYLQSFYQHGLITPGNGGVVLLNRLLDHSVLEGTSLSDLYLLSRAIFDCARAHQDVSPQIGKFGEAAGDTSWLFVPDGYYTMRHMLGVVFWDEAKPEPPMLKNQGDFVAWQQATLNSIMMNLMTTSGGKMDVSIMQPGQLFDSILVSTMSMLRQVVDTMAMETKHEILNPLARIVVGCDPEDPGRNHVHVIIGSKFDRESESARATIQLSIMESAEIAAVISCITEQFNCHSMECAVPEYFMGPAMEDAAPSMVH